MISLPYPAVADSSNTVFRLVAAVGRSPEGSFTRSRCVP